MPPILGHLISGTISDLLGNALAGATVTVTHESITPSLAETSDSTGKYIINLSGLSSQWSVGDTITITASKIAEGTKTITTVISSGGSQTVNITLAETSDLVFGTNSQDRYNLNFV